MYNIAEIESVHFEITNKCQARCPMCPRRILGGPENPFVEQAEILLDDFKKWFPVYFIKSLKNFIMCGNLGDPIVAKDTLKIFEYIKDINPGIELHMHTNGSGRSKDWWEGMAALDVIITFGIDGLGDTHHLYRIDTDWNKIISNAKIFIQAGGKARWNMLAFKHNEHQIESCQELSKSLGFEVFEVKHTSRFKTQQWRAIDDLGRTVHVLEPTARSLSMIPKMIEAEAEIKPFIDCKAVKSKQIYVAADGNVTACCWVDSKWKAPMDDYRIDYMDKIGVFHNLKNNSLEEIFNSGYFRDIADTWSTCALKECSKQCGSFNKFGEQFENRS
jgi:MoaA/NifB/PqqE/SkfB family radical SAM enzyme